MSPITSLRSLTEPAFALVGIVLPADGDADEVQVLTSPESVVAYPGEGRELLTWFGRMRSRSDALAQLESWGGTSEDLGALVGSGLVVELHGSLGTTSCLRCGERWLTRDVLTRLDDEPDPHHAGCGGVLKPDVVYFGELLSDSALERAVAAAQDAEVFLAIGTTLRVQPVASLAAIAADTGAELVIVNDQATPYDELATRIVRDPIDVAVPALVADLLTSRS